MSDDNKQQLQQKTGLGENNGSKLQPRNGLGQVRFDRPVLYFTFLIANERLVWAVPIPERGITPVDPDLWRRHLSEPFLEELGVGGRVIHVLRVFFFFPHHEAGKSFLGKKDGKRTEYRCSTLVVLDICLSLGAILNQSLSLSPSLPPSLSTIDAPLRQIHFGDLQSSA